MLRASFLALLLAVVSVRASAAGLDPPTKADEIRELQRKIVELEEGVATLQAKWDKLYAEYQRIMNATGGRLNDWARARVNKLDADARKIKADIDAQTRVLDATREHLSSLEDGDREEETPTPSAPPRRRDPDSEPSLEPIGEPVQRGADQTSWTREFRSELSDRHFTFDEWDPVGGLVGSLARVTIRVYREQFGSWSLTEQVYRQDLLYLGDGRRVLQGETHRFGQSKVGKLALEPELERDEWNAELAKGDMVEIRATGTGYASTKSFVEPREPHSGPGYVEMVVRFEDLGSSIKSHFYHRDGREAGVSVTELERVGEFRRPKRQVHQDRCVHSFRVFSPGALESTSPEPHRIFDWDYGADGRVSAVRMTRMRSSKPLPIGELSLLLADRQFRENLDRMIDTELRDETVMSYGYDDRGRLKSVRSVRKQFSLDPVAQMGVAAAVDTTTDAGSRGFFGELAAEAARRGPQNKKLDGEFNEVIEDDIWRKTSVLEMRVEEWDALGRWTRAVTYACDEAGEVPAYECMREFRDLSDHEPPIHAEYQLMPRKATPPLAQIASLGPIFRELARTHVRSGEDPAAATEGRAQDVAPARTAAPKAAAQSLSREAPPSPAAQGVAPAAPTEPVTNSSLPIMLFLLFSLLGLAGLIIAMRMLRAAKA